MKDTLVRFGVAMEEPLLDALDALVERRGATRSEVLRDLVRAEVGRARVTGSAAAVATVTLVYDHHVRDLAERLMDFQHSLGERVRSTLHVHLDHDNCLEVIVMHGRSDELRGAAEKLFATRGVKHGAIELIADERHAHDGHVHAHPFTDPHHHHEPARAASPKKPKKPRKTQRRR